jgi:phosphoenolpyruvate---glycerone phosphotransferase subunit DhaL
MESPRAVARRGERRYACATMPPRSGSSSVSRVRAAAPATVQAEDLRAYLTRCAAGIERHREYLTRLDAVLGDGDHGDNMAIGFQAVREMLAAYPAETSPGELLRAVGHRLATTVGGASGPLYGTALIEAGLAAGSATTLEWPLIGRMLDAAANGLARRGRCVVGDKTILDTLRPAADAALGGTAARDGAPGNARPAGCAGPGAPHGDALGAVLVAAWRGMRSTRPLVARRGLALRLGARSAGHLDPGAVSCFILLAAMVP